MPDIRELHPEELSNEMDPDTLAFETTAEIDLIKGTVGQERAISAINFGLGIQTQGFNIYVAGKPGTGRNTSISAIVAARAKERQPPPDWVYVNNFKDPYHPKAIQLSYGRGPEFARDMDEVIKTARTELPRAFESENYGKRRNEILEAVQKRRDMLLNELQQKAKDWGFSIEATPVGIASVPLTPEGRPYTREEYDSIPEEQRNEIKQKGSYLQDSINQFVARGRSLEKEAQDRLRELDKEVALFAVGHMLEDLREKYRVCDGLGDCASILDYLEHVENDIVERLDEFRSTDKLQQQQPGVPALLEEMAESTFDRYKVNVFVTHNDEDGAPVIRENNPTYNNLIGKIDFKARFGFMSTDHNMLKAGAIHRANGGYLILQALDVLLNPFSWDALKRVLRAREAAPENLADQYGIVSVATLKPQPIPLDLKVILVGSAYVYYLLYYLDEDFRKLFKVKADFDIEMKRTEHHVHQYASFIADRCKEFNLKPFHKTAVAKVVDYGSRIIEDKDRLSTRFIEISDLVSEANYWAEKDESEIVMERHVAEAVEQKAYRSKMIEDKIQSLIEEGVIMIDAKSSIIGQANGLSVYDLGDYSFGRPSRLTARVYAGRGKIVDIQRESEMGGPIHSKGVMILGGYIGGKYGAKKPIAMQATIAFEQLYEEVEGDSASSTELYVLLSALSGIPVKQSIAVTGSVDQYGRIQPIGGVNRKIEGFYEVCKAEGFTGEQGVMIPASNVRHLMLKREVIDAVRDGRFHIWPVKTIDQGIEILTGVQAGEEKPEGGYPEGTIHYLVEKKLKELAESVKEFMPSVPEPASMGANEPSQSI